MSTIFSSGSPLSQGTESQELSTLAAFVAHIERLQDQVRQKDSHIADLESDQAQLRRNHNQLRQEYNEIALQSDIQNELLQKSQQRDAHVEQLRLAILDREAIIGEKDKATRAAERELDLHKLLLQAEIRKHAVMKINTTSGNDALPELDSLAKKEDIHRWIHQLNERFRSEQTSTAETSSRGDTGPQVESLQQEIDFYVREISKCWHSSY